MNVKQQAAADLKRLSHMLKGVMEIGADLEHAGSLEQAASETQSRLVALQAEETAVKGRLAQMGETMTVSHAALQAMIRKADEYKEQSESEAATAAASVIAAARTEGAQIVGKAKGVVSDLDVAITERRKLLRELNGEIASAQTRLDSVNADLSNIRKRL